MHKLRNYKSMDGRTDVDEKQARFARELKKLVHQSLTEKRTHGQTLAVVFKDLITRPQWS